MPVMAKKSAPTPAVPTAPLIVVAGEDLFQRSEHIAALKQGILGDEDPGMALVRFDETASMATILDEVRTPSMFAPRKLVIVDPADKLFKANAEEEDAPPPPKGGKPAPGNRELLENYLESASGSSDASGVLVLVCTSWLKTTRLHKALDKQGAVLWAEAIKPQFVPAWLTRRARDFHGKALDPHAAARLGELIGPDLQRLDNELAKLALYQPQAPSITAEAVDALVGFQHEQPIWDMINALAARDARVALQKIDELWAMDPKIEYTAAGAVASWLNQVLKARELMDQRFGDGQIISALRLWPEDRARKILALARQWGLAGAARWSAALLQVDLDNKRSIGDPRRNLERFIVALCAA